VTLVASNTVEQHQIL